MWRTCQSCGDGFYSSARARKCGDCLELQPDKKSIATDYEDAVTRLDRDPGLRLWDMPGNDE